MPSAPETPDRLTTAIAEADHDSGRLRFRGVDVDELVANVTFGEVWGLLVDGRFGSGLPPAERFPLPVRTGDVRVDVQSALAQLAPVWGFRPLHDIDSVTAREQLARAATMAMSFIAQSARGADLPVVPEREIDTAETVVGRFMTRWRGDPDPAHVAALDGYFTVAAEHGMNASTLTARVIASTGADVAACLSGAVGAISGPLHGGAPSRALKMIQEAALQDDADAYVRGLLERGVRLMGFGHRIYRGEDPRVRAVRDLAWRLDAPLCEIAEAVETAALNALAERRPDQPIGVNMEFWAAVLFHGADVPPRLFTPMFICARSAGWSAHILEQKLLGRPIRPVATYVGEPARPATEVPGWEDIPPPRAR
ncbi:citrate synthase 2 [Austwickia sp. TVS 96-490-7B]|uniref:citrate synthase 2 n=1 Tax=Austwickia sp. TVS 96-490-7B TaxID=2830843 RepID=UPI001C5687EC|nr:citrate synthase 2 [Austwickia sp. TVS 96-490-7B]